MPAVVLKTEEAISGQSSLLSPIADGLDKDNHLKVIMDMEFNIVVRLL